jgi:hypothetical protein
MSSVSFDPIRVLDVLNSHGVRFVLIGGFAGRLWGSNLITGDLEICYARDGKNHAALAAALRDLGACLPDAATKFPLLLDAKTLESGDDLVFETRAGILQCLATPPGSGGFLDLIRGATEMTVDSTPIRVAALEDLIRMKRLTGRLQDLVELEILGALREEIERARREARA